MCVTREKEDCETRVAVYRILSLAFYPPTSDVNQVWQSLNQLAPHDSESGHNDETRLEPDKTSFEYNRLFVGPERLPCPPYESVYRKDRSEMQIGTVLGPSTLDVKQRYREAGLEISKNFKDLPDHVGAELEFMHYLCSKQLEVENVDESEKFMKMEKEFVELHLIPWVFSFADNVTRNTTSPFYSKAAFVLKEFMNDEEAHLGIG